MKLPTIQKAVTGTVNEYIMQQKIIKAFKDHKEITEITHHMINMSDDNIKKHIEY